MTDNDILRFIHQQYPAPPEPEPTPVYEESHDYLMLKSQVLLLEVGMRQMQEKLDEAQAYIAWLYRRVPRA